MFCILRALFLALIGVLPAVAQDDLSYADLTQNQQIGVIQTMIEAGQLDEAEVLLAVTPFDDGDAEYEAAFLQAVILRLRGDFAGAEAILRDILAVRPEFRLVRLELAQVLAAQGRREGAGYQFGILAETANSTAESQELDTMISALQPGSGFQPSAFLTIAPSTNFNNGASAQTVLIGGLPFRISNTAQSGVGVRYGGALTFTDAVSEDTQIYATLHAQRDDYRARAFDTDTAGVRLGVQHGTERDRFTAEIFGNRRWVNGEQFDDGYGLRLSVRHAMTQRLAFDGSTAIERRDYDNGTDSIRRTLTLGLGYAVNRQFGVRGGVRFDGQNSAVANLDYDAIAPTVGAYYRFDNGLLVDVSYEAEDRSHELIILGTRREDETSRTRLAVQWDRLRLGDVVPLITFTQTNNASTLTPFSYDARGVELTFSHAF
ncbi:surface lipoprotein assembly modifier [Pontivivens insulae]|uniref:Surface lipoprotein assembly modifier C-terminal domain-containing protein n=1 Tax=Pontivivens insulae TaxID=1639689 RepID=A0A2R8A7V6_9RHOB|nr:surface lipoprotein assembly modifier [Pontivivens insulae]RED18212.1 uncharacterized protein DUF560 [Pontivivens insulae]SPF28110.1 hypothetical protein POI8812_00408 [Pontivivens insulae]